MKREAVRIKRIYDPPEPGDGLRVLVDRIWPRGMKKESAALDRWMKDVAPSTELRRWFDHQPRRWPAFKLRYIQELKGNATAAELRAALKRGPVTLLYAARDPLRNNASALADYMNGRHMTDRPGGAPATGKGASARGRGASRVADR